MAAHKLIEGAPAAAADGAPGRAEPADESYRRLADSFGHLLSGQSLDALLEGVADALKDLIPYDSLTIYRADENRRLLTPVVARDQWAEEILASKSYFGRGLTGWAVENREAVLANEAHDDPRTEQIPGTPVEPEAMITVPLVCRGSIKGALNLYRIGEDASFSEGEFDLAQRFGDAAALAIDNAEIRERLEHQAQTDALTGLYNHRFFQERLRGELTRASRAHDYLALIVFDLDDFKRVNDIHGHGVGDHILEAVGELLGDLVRSSDVPCRIGGEEFAIILPSCDAGDAFGLARRLSERIAASDFDPAGRVTISVGIAQGPEHAMNPRELVGCAEAAMMTAKARGKNTIVLFDEDETERPTQPVGRGEVRSIAHMKMLHGLAGKLNRLNDVREIGSLIVTELRTLIDYHSCRLYMAENEDLVPIAFRGELELSDDRVHSSLGVKVGEGITGRVAATGKPLLIGNALSCEFAVQVPGTDEIDESVLAVPLSHGVKVIGVIVLSKLGADQFDGDDLRLLEVLSGHASVALQNARLYDAQRREAHFARAVLEFAEAAAKASSFHTIGYETASMAARLLETRYGALWLQDERTGEFRCDAHCGYEGDPEARRAISVRLAKEAGERFLAGLEGPRIVMPGEAVASPGFPEGIVTPVAVAPLFCTDNLKGWIAVRQPEGRADHFTEERMRLFAALASHASIAMQKALVYRSQKEAAEIAGALLDFSRGLADAEGLADVLDRTVEQAARILGSPTTGVWLQKAASGALAAAAVWGGAHDELLGGFLDRELPDDVVRPFLTGTEPFVVNPADVMHMEEVYAIASRSPVAVAPLHLDGDRLGCIAAMAPALGDYQFSKRKMRLLAGIASQAQIAINNELSYESLEQTFLDTVEALANALEAKDEYTSSHARWISDTSLTVGAELGMDNASLKRLELGALFHDIGKIGIPSSILRKPGPLDDDEWEVIKQHPELGERILSPIARLTDVRPIIRACHEHYDGGGYPDGLEREAIPIEARIILVVDAFHAMTTDRPYRTRMAVDEACRRLVQDAGGQFDPDVVDAFLRVIRDHPDVAGSAH